MQISLDLAELLARFAYVQTHKAETSEADRQRVAETLAAQVVHENDRLVTMMRAERVKRYGWHPPL